MVIATIAATGDNGCGIMPEQTTFAEERWSNICRQSSYAASHRM